MVEAQNDHPTIEKSHTQSNGPHSNANGSAAVDGSSTDSTDATDKPTAGGDHTDHAHANGVKHPATSNSLQVALTELVSKEVAQYAPLLIGKYYVQDKRALWAGRWGMTEAAFGPNGVTSAFEMKSDEDVYVRTASGDADELHPVFVSGSLAKSSQLEHPSSEQSHPAHIGYESDPAQRSAMPFDCKYSGFFQIQAVKGKPQTVTEKSVEIRFVHNASRPSQFYVSGLGENKFGVFNLVGLLDKETSEMRLYKIYKPKEKEKRIFPKRTRTVAVKPPTPAPTPAAVVQAPPPAPAVVPPVPAVTKVVLPVSTYVPAPAPTLSAARPSVSTPMGSDSSAPSPFTVSRGRSERKRVMPAHLRDENMLDHDHVPASLKKCLAILKSLMANPKAGPFLVPVDPVALGIPDYFNVIKEPMDLGTIRQNLEGGFYDDVDVFIDHVRLVFDNAMLYNAAHSQVHIFAAKLSENFAKRIKNINVKTPKDKLADRAYGALPATSSIIKLKRERKGEPTHSTKKIKGGQGAKGNTKRGVDGNEGLIMSLKEDIERLKATLEQLQPSSRVTAPKPSKGASRPFKMEDLTEEELNEPMTQAEKARLSDDIRKLPQEKINRVLQIIAESVPVSKLTNEHDEVEIDINSFDSRCLRMLEGYVRENGIGRKRKRATPKKPSKAAPASHRLKSAKVAAVNIRNRQEALKTQLARIDGDGGKAVAVNAVHSGDVDMDKPNHDDHSSSVSSSSSSDSSDSDSESDSESDSDAGAPLHRSPSLTGGATLSQVSDSVRGDGTKKIRDEHTSREPLRVENRGAWSLLAQKESSARSLMQPEDNTSSSLWNSARSREQEKQQKLQQQEQERSEEIAAQRRRELEQREREKEREREELQRRKQEEDAALRLAEDRVSDAEQTRSSRRAIEREKLLDDDGFDDHHEHTLTEDLESFSSSSFL